MHDVFGDGFGFAGGVGEWEDDGAWGVGGHGAYDGLSKCAGLGGDADEDGDAGDSDDIEEGDGAGAGKLPVGDVVAGAGEGDLVRAHVFGVLGEEAVAVEGVEAVAGLSFGEAFLPHGGDEEVEDADASGAGAEHGDFLLGEGDAGGVDGGEEGGGGDGRGALDVVVEGAEAVAVALEEAGCVDAGEVFPLEEDVGPAALDGFDEGFNEGVVVFAADAMVLPADVDGVGE